MLTLEHKSLEETKYLLSTKANAQAWRDGMTDANGSYKLTQEEWDRLTEDID